MLVYQISLAGFELFFMTFSCVNTFFCFGKSQSCLSRGWRLSTRENTNYNISLKRLGRFIQKLKCFTEGLEQI